MNKIIENSFLITESIPNNQKFSRQVGEFMLPPKFKRLICMMLHDIFQTWSASILTRYYVYYIYMPHVRIGEDWTCCYKFSTTVGNHPPTYMHLLYARFMETNHELERKIWKGSVFELAATSTSNICIFSFYFRERKMLYITTLENNV